MDLSCIEIIIGSTITGLSVGFGAGFLVGKTRVTKTLKVPCSILVEEVMRLNKLGNLNLKPKKRKTYSIGGKVVQVACHKLNKKTSICEINGKKCILLA